MDELAATRAAADQEFASMSAVLDVQVADACQMLASRDRIDVWGTLTVRFAEAGRCTSRQQIFTASMLALTVLKLAEKEVGS